ncbi:pentatricopeptide repeat-containing protein At5g66520-like [Tasmannia lanceolata]|uniref:pentatricopeptide repeat-containing protein At5g66520-like n=1 Tax=Tasmannia lanceolata TaxID=3420 RepID=UPI004062F411
MYHNLSLSAFSRHLESLIQRSTTISHLLQLHSLILKTALDRDQHSVSQFISSSSVISVDFARSVFDHLPFSPTLPAWNSMIRGYAKSPYSFVAIELFSDLRRTSARPDRFTYPFILTACARSSMLWEGGMVHCLVLKSGFVSNSYVGNTLLNMYAACGAIGLARQAFDEMAERDIVSWSSMIGGYVTCNRPLDALMVFQKMKAANVEPNSITLVNLLSACTHLNTLNMGESIHSYIVVNKVELEVSLGTALVKMYAKCGEIEKAVQVFSSLSVKNLQSWTIMMSCFADHGRGKDVISLFTQMELSGINPDSMSFSSILCACSHLGLVDEGRWYFDRMINVYSIQPTLEHYGCMVDLFGRAGLVEEAYEFIKNMSVEPNAIILRSFISACRNHGKVFHVDESLMKLLLEIEPNRGANYVLAANVSAIAGQWEDVAQLRRTMAMTGLKKVSGCSWVEVKGDHDRSIITEGTAKQAVG